MNALENLKAARALISDPKAWGQGSVKNISRKNTLCSAQALFKAANLDYFDHHIMHAPGGKALESAMSGAITIFNDTHSHADVLAAFDRAIKIAGAAS